MRLQVNFCLSPEWGPKANLSISESFYKPLQYLSKLQLILLRMSPSHFSEIPNLSFLFPVSLIPELFGKLRYYLDSEQVSGRLMWE